MPHTVPASGKGVNVIKPLRIRSLLIVCGIAVVLMHPLLVLLLIQNGTSMPWYAWLGYGVLAWALCGAALWFGLRVVAKPMGVVWIKTGLDALEAGKMGEARVAIDNAAFLLPRDPRARELKDCLAAGREIPEVLRAGLALSLPEETRVAQRRWRWYSAGAVAVMLGIMILRLLMCLWE